MERYMYYCNKCGFIGSAEHKEPTERQVCGNCHSDMKSLLMTSSQWHEMSAEDKEQMKDRLLNDAKTTNEYDEALYQKNKYIQYKSENIIAFLIKIIAIGIYIVGFIYGLAASRISILGDHYFSFWNLIFFWVSAFVAGTMVLGFSEIIRLLDRISKK
jgi:ribosomal protein S27AE